MYQFDVVKVEVDRVDINYLIGIVRLLGCPISRGFDLLSIYSFREYIDGELRMPGN
jgi:hypothetical protein